MSSIFVSHASKDEAAARLVAERLRVQGFESLFLDVSEEKGLRAGGEWEQDLYRKLRGSRCVVALCSEAFLASKWCFAEVTQARALGKPVFPVRLDDTPLDGMLNVQQAVDLRPSADEAEAYRRLCAGLDEAGILRGTWDRTRLPYPGLSAFEKEDRAVFFGRDAVIEEGLSRLTVLRQRGGPRWLLLLGSSGCGKSSVLRAGMLPRIGKDEPHWLVVGPIRPGSAGMERLAQALSTAFKDHEVVRDWKALLDELRTASSEVWSRLVGDLRAAAKRPEAHILLIVDQLEEVLALGGPEHADTKAADELLRVLRQLSDLESAACFVLGTLRSDFLGSFQQHAAMRDLITDELVVKPLARKDIARVIEGPAQLAGIGLESGLVDEMVRDTETEEALPLLAFALRELYERYGGDGLLEVREYRDGLGGLQRCLAQAAEGLLREEQRRLSPHAFLQLKSALLSLVRLSDEGAAARRRVRWDSLPSTVHRSLEAFVQARLLVSRGENAQRELEVAHESLFRVWPELSGWIGQNKALLAWRKRVDARLERWRELGKRAELSSGSELAEGLGWLERQPLLVSDDERAFLRASKASARARARGFATIVVGVIIALGALAGWAVFEKQDATRQQARAVEQTREATLRLGETQLEQARRTLFESQRPLSAISTLYAARLNGVDSSALRALFREAIRNLWTAELAHSDEVVSVSFSPEGKRVVTASLDKTARVWDARTGRALVPPLSHVGAVRSASFSPDGARVATASDDNTARLWDAHTGRPVGSPFAHGGAVLAVAFSPDGTRLVTASVDKTARVWDIRTAKGVTLDHAAPVLSASFSSDGERVVTASKDETARVWDARTGRALSPPLKHVGGVLSASFSPDGQRVVTGTDQGSAYLWEALSGRNLLFRTAAGKIFSVIFSPNGDRVLMAIGDGTAHVWDVNPRVRSGNDVARVADARTDARSRPFVHSGAVLRAAFSPDGERVVTASADMTARIWDARTGHALTLPLAHEGEVVSAAFSPDGSQVVTASSDGTSRVWDVRTGALSPPLPDDENATAASFSPDGARVVIASGTTAQVRDARTGILLSAPLEHGEGVVSASFSPDGKWVLTAGEESTARVWDVQTGQALTPPLAHAEGLVSASFSRDGARALTASKDGTAQVWDARTGQRLGSPLTHGDAVLAASFSSDGTRVVTASADRTARVWDAATGKAVSPALMHAGIVWSASFSRDGWIVATAGDFRAVQLWDVGTWQPRRPLSHPRAVSSASFSPGPAGSRLVVTASEDNTARVWDAETGSARTPPLVHGGRVSSASFGEGSPFVLTASKDGMARLWDLDMGREVSWLLHTAAVGSASFSPDGTRLVTVSDGKAQVWDVGSDSRSLREWQALQESHGVSLVIRAARQETAGELMARGFALEGRTPGQQFSRASNLLASAFSQLPGQPESAQEFAAEAAQIFKTLERRELIEAQNCLAIIDLLRGDIPSACRELGANCPSSGPELIRFLANQARYTTQRPALEQLLLAVTH